MKIGVISAQNFSSFEDFHFNLADLGLCLIQGHTGAGKSTLEDIVPWTLFGITSKNGAVDEVKRWECNDYTRGIVCLDIGNKKLVVVRTRGTAKENDLYWIENDNLDTYCRGKDLSDTQKKLNTLLGTDGETYCLTNCFNEVSETTTFFGSTPKNKRRLLEKLVDMNLAKTIAEKTLEHKKVSTKDLEKIEREAIVGQSRLEHLANSIIRSTNAQAAWSINHQTQLELWQTKITTFESEKANRITELEDKVFQFVEDTQYKIESLIDKIDALDKQIKPATSFEQKSTPVKFCKECGREVNAIVKAEANVARLENDRLRERRSELMRRLQELQNTTNPYKEQLTNAQKQTNVYIECLNDETTKVNPFDAVLAAFKQEETTWTLKLSQLQNERQKLQIKIDALTRLNELSYDLRAVLLKNTVSTVQTYANTYLSDYFASEFKVEFELVDSDQLKTTIYKNGYAGTFNQLSKGQKQLLRFCFAVTCMVYLRNASSITSNVLFFDEALDGLDSELKIKSLGLFNLLSTMYSSILLIDHSLELQAMISNKLSVKLIGDKSQIYAEEEQKNQPEYHA